jgi:hypothetical protein
MAFITTMRRKTTLCIITISAYAWWAKRHHDIQHKDTQHKGKKHDTQLKTLIITMKKYDTLHNYDQC